MAKSKYRGQDDYLNIEKLLKQYTPLMNSVYKKFSSYNGVFNNSYDYEDLRAQIELEFVRLVQEYDPTRGVDFAGYIKFHLQQRVYHWVTKIQRVQNHEAPAAAASWEGDGDDSSVAFENSEELSDPQAEYLQTKTEALACLDWRILQNTRQRRLIEMILFENKTLEDIAEAEHTSLKTIRLRFERVCDLFIQHHKNMVAYFGDFDD